MARVRPLGDQCRAAVAGSSQGPRWRPSSRAALPIEQLEALGKALLDFTEWVNMTGPSLP